MRSRSGEGQIDPVAGSMRTGSEIVICGVPFGTPAEEDALKLVKEHGFTSVQIYTFWNRFERERQGAFAGPITIARYHSSRTRALNTSRS